MRVLHAMTASMSLRFLDGQVQFMRRQGIDVHVVSSAGEEQELMRDAGASVHSLCIDRGYAPMKDIAALAALRRLIRTVQPDIVHSHTPKAGLLGMLAASMEGVQSRIYQVRGLPLSSRRGLERALLRKVEAASCRLATRVLVNSFGLRSDLIAERICPAEKIGVPANGSGNGVDVDRFRPGVIDTAALDRVRQRLMLPAGAPIVGFIGRLTADKGLNELLDAWEHIRAARGDAMLLLVGPNESRGALSARLNRARTDARLRFAGNVQDVRPYLSVMDVVCLPTYREGLPNVLLEAAAMEIPVVATAVTGCTEVVDDGATGRLVPSHNPVALAEATVGYLRDPALRLSHGRAARERANQKYPQVKVWQAVYAEYRTAVAPVRTS